MRARRLFSAAALCLLLSAPVAGQELAVELTGRLSYAWSDPMPESGQSPRLLVWVNDARSGEIVELTGTMLPQLAELAGNEVTLRGKADGASLRAQELVSTADDASVSRLEPAVFDRLAQASTPKPFVSILCSYADITAQPRPASFFTSQLSSSFPGMDHYFRAISYDTVNLAGSKVVGWVKLPKTHQQYWNASAGVALGWIAADCTAAARAKGFDFSGYAGINLMMNAQLNGTAVGGKTFLNLDGAGRAWPVTWMPYHGETTHFGWRQHGILAHEMSHAFGSPHSADNTGYQYGSSWDVVSHPSAGCPPFDAEYGCIGQGTVTYGLMRMGFLDPARVFTYDGTPKTVEIERLANPTSTTSYLAVKINVTSQRFFTIEARHRVGYDAKLPVNGVIISDVDLARLNVSPAVSYLVAPPDAPADSLGQGKPRGTGHTAAAWTVGSTFVSTSPAVRVTVVAETATGFVLEFTPLNRPRARPSRSL